MPGRAISGLAAIGCGTSVESTPTGVDTPTETSSAEHAAGEKAAQRQGFRAPESIAPSRVAALQLPASCAPDSSADRWRGLPRLFFAQMAWSWTVEFGWVPLKRRESKCGCRHCNAHTVSAARRHGIIKE